MIDKARVDAKAQELLALADRVEAATGADRALDTVIAAAVHPHGEMLRCLNFEGWEKHIERNPGISWVPFYTSSLDAAMTLVPEGAGFNLDRYWIREGERWKVEIATGGIPEQPRKVFDCWDAYGPAQATTAATLRALAAKEADNAD